MHKRTALLLVLVLLLAVIPATAQQKPLAIIEICDSESDCWIAEDGEVVRPIVCSTLTFRSVSQPPNTKITTIWLINDVKKSESEVFDFSPQEPHKEYKIELNVSNEYGSHSTQVKVIPKKNEVHEIDTIYIEMGDEEQEYELGKKIEVVTAINNIVTIKRDFETQSDDELTTEIIGDVIIEETDCYWRTCETTLRFPKIGSISVEIIDKDLCGQGKAILLDVEVIKNRLPTAEISGETIVDEGERMYLCGEDSTDGGDRDDRILEYCWQINRWGENISENERDWACYSNPSYELTEEFGEYNATLKVRDLYGGEARTTALVAFNRTWNRKPTINLSGTLTKVRLFENVIIDTSNSTDDNGMKRVVVEPFYVVEEDIYYEYALPVIESSNQKVNISFTKWMGTYLIRVTVYDTGDLPDRYGNPFSLSDYEEIEIKVVGFNESIEECRPVIQIPGIINEDHRKVAEKGKKGILNIAIFIGKLIVIAIMIIVIVSIMYGLLYRIHKKRGKKPKLE